MLVLKAACERCNDALAPDAAGALICSFECTFCASCGEQLNGACPNCGGDLQPRPTRAAELLEKYPAGDATLAEGFSLRLADAVKQLPGPENQPFAELIRRGTLSVEVFSPKGVDTQQPHEQDELYVVVSGTAVFDNNGARTAVAQGDLLFVAAGLPHRFEDFSDDFTVWVIFYGPPGGEG